MTDDPQLLNSYADDLADFDDLTDLEGLAPLSSTPQLYEHLRMEVDRGQVPLRIDKYLTEHPDLMGHSLVQHSGRHYRMCVARAQTPQRLYQFMSELPKPYSKGWVFEEKLK